MDELGTHYGNGENSSSKEIEILHHLIRKIFKVHLTNRE
jgi:hypothetical protein